MVLESTIVCFDNSDYQRNGDYFPTRLNVQKDGVNLVCLTKTRSNPENNVGLLTMSNKVEVLTTLTTDLGRILSKMHLVQPNGEMNLIVGIRIAHLILKHRPGKNHKMRIVAFVGSPVNNESTEMVKLAKKLKKEKVNVDIINFGEHPTNNEILTTFINSINGTDGTGSHLVSVPRGSMLSDALLSSSIICGEDGLGGAGLGGTGFEFGVDPNEDPELALALRVSMEEQRQRQEDEQRRTLQPLDDENMESTFTEKKAAGSEKVSEANTEETMLKRALALSTKEPVEVNLPDFSKMTEDEQIAFAMQMSMQDSQQFLNQPECLKSDVETPMEIDEIINDTEVLQSVLESLPGIDPDSEEIQNVMKSLSKDKKSKDKNNEKK